MRLVSNRDEALPDMVSPEVRSSVVVIIPARNETRISEGMGSLLRQDYRGPLTIMVVDDDSEDDAVSTTRVFQNGNRHLALDPCSQWKGRFQASASGAP